MRRPHWLTLSLGGSSAPSLAAQRVTLLGRGCASPATRRCVPISTSIACAVSWVRSLMPTNCNTLSNIAASVMASYTRVTVTRVPRAAQLRKRRLPPAPCVRNFALALPKPLLRQSAQPYQTLEISTLGSSLPCGTSPKNSALFGLGASVGPWPTPLGTTTLKLGLNSKCWLSVFFALLPGLVRPISISASRFPVAGCSVGWLGKGGGCGKTFLTTADPPKRFSWVPKRLLTSKSAVWTCVPRVGSARLAKP